MATSTATQLPYVLFMIRFWTQSEQALPAGRAELIDVVTGNRRAFPTLQALVDFIKTQPGSDVEDFSLLQIDN